MSFEEFNYTINLGKTQQRLLKTWQKEQDAKVALKQKSKFPHYGADGGGYSWVITPSGLGTCIEVENVLTKERINLTDYSSW